MAENSQYSLGLAHGLISGFLLGLLAAPKRQKITLHKSRKFRHRNRALKFPPKAKSQEPTAGSNG